LAVILREQTSCVARNYSENNLTFHKNFVIQLLLSHKQKPDAVFPLLRPHRFHKPLHQLDAIAASVWLYQEFPDHLVFDDNLLSRPKCFDFLRVADALDRGGVFLGIRRHAPSKSPIPGGFWVFLGSSRKGFSEIDRGFRMPNGSDTPPRICDVSGVGTAAPRDI
jgi:hypothetical protein